MTMIHTTNKLLWLILPVLVGCAPARTENTIQARNDASPVSIRPAAIDSVHHVACYSYNRGLNYERPENCVHLDSLFR